MVKIGDVELETTDWSITIATENEEVEIYRRPMFKRVVGLKYRRKEGEKSVEVYVDVHVGWEEKALEVLKALTIDELAKLGKMHNLCYRYFKYYIKEGYSYAVSMIKRHIRRYFKQSQNFDPYMPFEREMELLRKGEQVAKNGEALFKIEKGATIKLLKIKDVYVLAKVYTYVIPSENKERANTEEMIVVIPNKSKMYYVASYDADKILGALSEDVKKGLKWIRRKVKYFQYTHVYDVIELIKNEEVMKTNYFRNKISYAVAMLMEASKYNDELRKFVEDVMPELTISLV